MQQYQLTELERANGLAHWSVVGAQSTLVFTEDIKDTLSWMALNAGIVRTIIPREYL